MSYQTQYVHLPDDTLEHIIGDGQRTECGVAIPYNSPWTREPEGRICVKCAKASEAVAGEPEPAMPEPEKSKAKATGGGKA